MSVTSYKHTYFTGYLGPEPAKRSQEVLIIKDKAHRIHEVTVHRFTMGDVEDPDIYAAEPLFKWQKSEQGSWVMEHAIESPVWHRMIDHASYGYTFVIRAKLKDTDYTFYQLKWG